MADGTSETREKGAGEATSAPGAAVDAVFAATGIHPHAHLGTSSSSPGTPSGSELTRAGTAGSEQQPTDAEYAVRRERDPTRHFGARALRCACMRTYGATRSRRERIFLPLPRLF